MLKAIAHTLIFCIISTNVAYANDTAFGGTGAAPMPLKHESVTMLGEKIIISGTDIARKDMQGRWNYDCTYFFKNDSNNTLRFQMGFPFPINDETTDTTVPQGFKTYKGNSLVYEFNASVDGKSVPVFKSKISPLPKLNMFYSDAYLWPMVMQPQQTMTIQHHYITGVTINVAGQNYVQFVLRTGGLWKGGIIHRAEIDVIPNTPTRLCNELNKENSYLVPKPPGLNIEGAGKDRKYVWRLINFKPQDDLELCLMTAKNYVHYQIVLALLGRNTPEIAVTGMSQSELRYLRNTIYAQYGKQFQDKSLQEYFNRQWWYAVNPHYSDHFLNADDKNALELISKQESRTH